MANKKISDLSAASALAGTELMELVQSGGNVSASLAALLVYFGKNTRDSLSVTTTGGTITLDFANKPARSFVGATSISGNKTIALANTTGAIELSFMFVLTAAVIMTFPTSFYLSNSDISAHNVWTPALPGTFNAIANFDGTNWYVTITQYI